MLEYVRNCACVAAGKTAVACMNLAVFGLKKPKPPPPPALSRQFLQNLIIAIVPVVFLAFGGPVTYLAFEIPKAMQNQNKMIELQGLKMQTLSEQIASFAREQLEWQKRMEERMGRVEQKIF